jgi:hypothetical protein
MVWVVLVCSILMNLLYMVCAVIATVSLVRIASRLGELTTKHEEMKQKQTEPQS